MKKVIIIFLVFIIPIFLNQKVKENNSHIAYKYTTSEIYINNEDKQIYGILYKLVNIKKGPIIIYSHGLGGSHLSGLDYGKELAKAGYFFYAFDFCGGSSNSRSDGLTTEMSVLTEASDLEAVLNEVKTWDFINLEKIILFGTSQGGVVSSLVASNHADEVNGLILFYPAFVITDDIHKKYPTKEDIPSDTNYFGWINVSSKYMLDIYDLDLYEKVANYSKDVLIVHGNQDEIVDLKYSKKLQDTYQNSELKVIDNAGHGFYGNSFQEALLYIFDYLNLLKV